MHELLYDIFGVGKDLNVLQMTCRGILVFFIAWGLLRISGRRSFSLRSPLDNVITISLGAILSRGVVGASPFIPVVVASLAIVVLHRIMAFFISRNKKIDYFMEGDKILLYEKGKFNSQNMRKALISREDIIEGIRKSASTEQLEKIDKVYIERNGEITVLKAE